MCDKLCESCKYLWSDISVNAFECTCEHITEEQLDKHFTNGESGCSCWEEDVISELEKNFWEVYMKELKEAIEEEYMLELIRE